MNRLHIILPFLALCVLILGYTSVNLTTDTKAHSNVTAARAPLQPGAYHEKTAEQQYILEKNRPVTRADEVAACKARGRKLKEVEPNESPLRSLITCSGGKG